MRPPAAGSLARLLFRLLLQVVFLTQAPSATGQELSTSPQPHLAADVRIRIAQAATDSTLEPWQREFMLEVARGRVEGGATEPSQAIPGLALPPAGIAANDGAWTAVSSAPARHSHTAIYDPVRDRMVVFGGRDAGGYLNDVWALTLAGSPAWSALAPTGSLPTARHYHTAIYDPVRDRMVVFGGLDGGLRNDVWALSLAGSPEWSALTAAGSPPPARYGHTAFYDPVRDRMVVFGGYDGSYYNDVWALSLAGSPAWSELAPPGGPPIARYGHTAIYDPMRDRMVVFGGLDASGFRNDTWALTLAGSPVWSALVLKGSPPFARHLHAAIYDPVRDRMVVFGGWHAGGYLNDVWSLALAGSPDWSELTAGGNPPAGRYSHTAFYDPVRDRMVAFGGSDGGILPNDAWALTLAGSPEWSALTAAGSPPSTRYGHTAFYDPMRDRMVVFGGYDGSYHNDVWALSLAGSPEWSALAPVGGPPSARDYHTAIYDPVRDRMLVFGGHDGGILANDVWALTLAGNPVWSTLAPAGSPPSARYGHTAFYDPLRDRMVVFGGSDASNIRNDAWALTLAGSPAWSALALTGSPPSERYLHTAFYDPVRNSMVVFGGFGFGGFLNDVWALALAKSPAWSALTPAGGPPAVRAYHTAIYDPVRDRMVAFGGFDGISLRNDVWALGWAPPVSVPGDANALPRRFALAPPRPNPSRGETTVDFELVEPARVVLDVYDVRGRRVRRIADGWYHAGRHLSTWRGDDERGHALGSGVYFIRMQTDGFRATRRMVRVR